MLSVTDLKNENDLLKAIENELVIVETENDLERVIKLCIKMMYAQGFYNKIYCMLKDETVESLPIIV